MKFIVTILALGVLVSLSAWAHAVLVDSSPAANAVVHGDRLRITLHFNSRVDGKRSQLTLISTNGQSQIPLEQQSAPDTLTSGEATVRPGPYRLIWQVLAADGHLTRGQIPFKVMQ